MLTFEQYLVKSVVDYPSLYASPSFEITKFMVSDYVFNCIGTNVSSTIIEGICSDTEVIPQHYIDGTELFYVYDPAKAKMHPKYNWIMNQHECELNVMTLDELMKIPGMDDRYYFSTGNNERTHPLCKESDGPYPNFNKRYSLVWRPVTYTPMTWDAEKEEMIYGEAIKVNFTDLSYDWRVAAIEFYEKCLEYFKSDRCSGYTHGFNEDDSNDKAQQIVSMIEALSRYGDIKTAETQEIITQQYKLKFDGDVEAFLRLRWAKERQRIIDFIEETIAYVKDMK